MKSLKLEMLSWQLNEIRKSYKIQKIQTSWNAKITKTEIDIKLSRDIKKKQIQL